MRTWFRGPLLPSRPSLKIKKSKAKSGKGKGGKAAMMKVKNHDDTPTETEEIPSPTSPKGAKHMALSSTNSEMDAKRAAAMLERRRVSASVHEIRDLYSALQELVPGSAASSLHHRVISPDNKPTGASSNPSSPSLRRRLPSNGPRDVARSPTSEDESTRVRRLLPVTPDSLPNFNPKVIQALDVNANQSLAKGKRTPNMGRRGSSGEVLLSLQSSQVGKPSPNMGRRGSSGEVLLGVRANHIKAPKSPLAMTRSASHHDIANAVAPSPVKLDRLVSPEVLARRGSEGVLLTPKMDKHHKKLSPLLLQRRGSSGDVLTSERPVTLPRSGATSPRNGPMLDSGSDSSPRRGSLISALTKFSHSFKKKTPPPSPERKETAPIRADSNGTDQVDGPVQSQMDRLLNSLNDLEGTSKETMHGSVNDREILKKHDQRRGSLGTEMQELLGALHELSTMTTSSDSDSLGENEARPRRGSYDPLCDRFPVQRESLDQLEAYFTEKLRDATRANNSKTPSERSSESDAPQSDKEDVESSQPPSELSSKKNSLEAGMAEEETDVVDHPPEVLTADTEVKRPQLTEDREEFAHQVNKKLQDWLEKAMALSEKEKLTTNENFTTIDSDETKYDSLDSDEGDYNRAKEPKRLKRNLFSKLSLLRRGDKRAKYKHRRTRSMHDVTFSLESERSLQNQDDQNATAIETEEKMRRPSVTRSRSMYNVTLPRNKEHRKRQAKEAEDVPQKPHAAETQACVTIPDEKAIETSHVVTTSSKDYCDVHDSRKSPPTTTKPEVNTTPNRQMSENTDVKRSSQKTRLCRLPTDLPFFYTPETEKPCNGKKHSKKTNTRKKMKLFPKNSAICTGTGEIFYNEKAIDAKKLRKTCSNTLPHPRILVNESTNYFFGTSPDNNKSQGGTLCYQGVSQPLTPLRRFASVDSFLDSKDCEEPGANGSSSYGNELLADDAVQKKLFNGQSPVPSPPPNEWAMEFTI